MSAVAVDQQLLQEVASNVNISVLRRLDADFLHLVQTASHTAVYKLQAGKWQRCDVEGATFIYQRRPSAQSTHEIICVNRLSPENFSQNVPRCAKSDIEIVDDHMITFPASNGDIYGIWFYVSSEIEPFYDTLCQVAQGTAVPPVTRRPKKPESPKRKARPTNGQAADNPLQKFFPNLHNAPNGVIGAAVPVNAREAADIPLKPATPNGNVTPPTAKHLKPNAQHEQPQTTCQQPEQHPAKPQAQPQPQLQHQTQPPPVRQQPLLADPAVMRAHPSSDGHPAHVSMYHRGPLETSPHMYHALAPQVPPPAGSSPVMMAPTAAPMGKITHMMSPVGVPPMVPISNSMRPMPIMIPGMHPPPGAPAYAAQQAYMQRHGHSVMSPPYPYAMASPPLPPPVAPPMFRPVRNSGNATAGDAILGMLRPDVPARGAGDIAEAVAGMNLLGSEAAVMDKSQFRAVVQRMLADQQLFNSAFDRYVQERKRQLEHK